MGWANLRYAPFTILIVLTAVHSLCTLILKRKKVLPYVSQSRLPGECRVVRDLPNAAARARLVLNQVPSYDSTSNFRVTDRGSLWISGISLAASQVKAPATPPRSPPPKKR